MDENKLTGIASLFMTSGRPCSARRLGNGLINDTFIIACQPGGHSYVLQRINTDIFRDPDTLQDNMLAISAHLRKCLIEEGIADADRRALECVLQELRHIRRRMLAHDPLHRRLGQHSGYVGEDGP